jgi:putative endonuclease
MGGWRYITTNRRDGTLYIGVTNDLVRRVWEHRGGVGSSFVRRYNLTRLAYFELHEDIRSQFSVRLLVSGNPEWTDLYATLLS